jgi:hypothetical protein
MGELRVNNILFRKSLDEEGEFETACDSWGANKVLEFRSQVPDNSVVIGRYSVLPYYKELEEELSVKGSKLINSFNQHEFIARMKWAEQINTPRTWSTTHEIPSDYEGAFVLKGLTNSRKFQWNTHMFAPNRQAIPSVLGRLLDDSMIREQGIVIREFVPLRKLGEGINGLPVTNEWRCFFLGCDLLASGFYWATEPDLAPCAHIPPAGLKEAQRAARTLSFSTNFFVVDVAECDDGSWKVIEVNDGQMSGLSLCDPRVLYDRLKAFAKEYNEPSKA